LRFHGFGRLGMLVLLVACNGDAASSGPREVGGVSPVGVIVSGPVPMTHLSAASSRRTRTYVSAAPNTVPGAAHAIIRIRGGDSAVAFVTEGGFDPVPLAAAEGAEVTVTIDDSSGRSTMGTARVRRKPPRVVRTSPASQRSDVPLNIRVAVVFSAPMDGASVGEGLHLLRDGEIVPSEVRLSPDGIAAEVVPATNLAASADYELRVDDAMRDVLGQKLENEVRVTFRTAAGVDTSGADPANAGPWDLEVYVSRHSEPLWHDPASGRYWRPRALFPGDTLWLRASRWELHRESLLASWQSMTPGVVQVQVMPSGREAYAVAIAPGTAEVRAQVTAPAGSGSGGAAGVLRLQVFEPMPASMLAGARLDLARDASVAFRQDVDGTNAVPLGDAASLVSASVWWEEPYSGYGFYLAWRKASVRPDGRLAASRGSAVLVADAVGGTLRTLATLPILPELGGCPVWSPDGRYIAVTGFVYPEISTLFIIDTETSTSRELLGEYSTTCPVWHPDGTRFVVNRFLPPYSFRANSQGAFSVSREGNDSPVALSRDLVAGPFASDGGALLVVDMHGNLYRAGIDGTQRVFIAAVGRVSPVAWSADGRLIAMPYYIMSADGRYARNVDGEILGFAP
jgi:hypothetical protein